MDYRWCLLDTKGTNVWALDVYFFSARVYILAKSCYIILIAHSLYNLWNYVWKTRSQPTWQCVYHECAITCMIIITHKFLTSQRCIIFSMHLLVHDLSNTLEAKVEWLDLYEDKAVKEIRFSFSFCK